ncbi:carboxylesterase family protein [Aquimarina pacifica]|uniref:carboxylesterase family protein n=1 Tax=Aquimarina pacifica TaxID=1296415 RepID=UPI0004726869|nr:hypothetical protein [Aquimarina pacifica]
MRALKKVIKHVRQIGRKETSFLTIRKIVLNNYSGLFLIIWILLISSCSTPENPDVGTPEQTTPTVQEPVLNIDDSDLKDLPVDMGGSHIAYPLNSTNAVFGHFVYTPSEYTQDGPEYPLLVFLHGWDPTGYTGTDVSELNELLVGTTPPGLIRIQRWNPSFPFIVASPRLKSYGYWRHQDIHDFIKYMIDEYQVNTKRIYLTGLSLGGGGAWYYVGERGEDNYVAAIIPISARGEERIVSNLTKIPIWAFHGDSDTTVPPYDNYGSVPLVAAINAKSPKTWAKVTVFNNTGHDAWSRVYSNRFTTMTRNNPFNVSIYDWLLQYKKE